VRTSLVDVMTPEQFSVVGEAMGRVVGALGQPDRDT